MLQKLVDHVEARLHRLGRQWLNEDPTADLREEAEQLSDQLQQSLAALERNRAEVESLRHKLENLEINAAMLVSRVETYVHVGDRTRAWQDALELDHVRHSLRKGRTYLDRCEESHRRQQSHVAQLEGQLANLLVKLYPN